MRPDQGEHDKGPKWQLPPLLHFLAMHLVLGAAIGVAAVSLAVLFNLAGLHDLLVEAEDPVVPMVLLYSFSVINCSSVSMGVGIMTLPSE
jgi:hypothetical protein